MTRRLLSFVVPAVAFVLVAATPATSQDAAARPDECHEWHACRQLALDALARGEYERFHDLAWRTVQTGPPRDPALMYLLARAQSLSGRPHDALVMLDRLADMGVATDAANSDEFKAVRALREWPEVDAKITALTSPKLTERAKAEERPAAASAPVPKPAAPTTAEEPASPELSIASPRPAPEDAVSVGDVAFTPHGLAYDAVSSRFVVADPGARKLVVFDERSHRALDLVRASSAGFGAIAAFEIDAHRGDLWVVSAGEPDGSQPAIPTLHKLQLVSGRPIARYPVSDDLKVARLDDVAVTSSGVVLMLDSAGRRIVSFDPAAHAFKVAATFDVDGATSLAPADDRNVYVAHRDGILHVDLGSRSATPVQPAADTTLAGFARIRWSRGSLVGVQKRDDGMYHVVQVKLGNHRARIVEIAGRPVADPTAVTLSGSDLYVLTRSEPANDREIVVQRIRLR